MTNQTKETKSALIYTFGATKGNEKISVRAELSDECRNGYAHFALTCSGREFVKNGRGYGKWEDSFGGCAHETILEWFPNVPELKALAALHLSDQDGIPMHGIANAFYWFCGMFADGLGAKYHGGSGRDGKSAEECRAILKDHLRATDEQLDALVALSPRSDLETQMAIEEMGFLDQWKAEALAVAAWLEEKTGAKFAFERKRETYKPLTLEQKTLILERRSSGYYTPEQIAERDLAKRNAEKAKRRANAKADHAATLEKAAKELALKLCVIDCDNRAAENVILYTYTNTVAANWTDTEALWTEADFNQFAGECKQSPELAGVNFEFKAKPRKY